MPQYNCPTCESEDLEAYELTGHADGKVTCPYCPTPEDGVARALQAAAKSARMEFDDSGAHALAKAFLTQLDGWRIGTATDGSVEPGIYHTCEIEPVTWMDGRPVADILVYALTQHHCEDGGPR